MANTPSHCTEMFSLKFFTFNIDSPATCGIDTLRISWAVRLCEELRGSLAKVVYLVYDACLKYRVTLKLQVLGGIFIGQVVEHIGSLDCTRA